MTTAKILIKTSVFAIASDLHEIQNHLRITHEMTLDELCEGSPGDPHSMEQMHERIFFLIGGVSKKLNEMEALSEKLSELARASMLTA